MVVEHAHSRLKICKFGRIKLADRRISCLLCDDKNVQLLRRRVLSMAEKFGCKKMRELGLDAVVKIKFLKFRR